MQHDNGGPVVCRCGIRAATGCFCGLTFELSGLGRRRTFDDQRHRVQRTQLRLH